MEFEMVLGLEVHTELATATKIFCGCTTVFVGAPNTHVCEVCTGMPGSLPVLNEQVVEFAIRTGLATNCEITRFNRFDRKNYFYPDLPKAYQVSQLYAPICQGGHMDIAVNGETKTIRIKEIHMEEDAGKLIHDAKEGSSLVDYNRCGVPLLEIVTEPDFRSGEEVLAFLTELKATLQYIGVSDCKMEQGSLRADVNLSVRPVGQTELGTRTEMKNLNSFRAIGRAIEWEKNRQIALLQAGGEIVQETRRWDDNKGEGYSMRTKENAQDYRYFPEPDLPPLHISQAWIDRVSAALPELPAAKKARYLAEYGLPVYDVDIITASVRLVHIFEGALAVCGNAKECSNWILGEVLRMAAETATPAEDIAFAPENLGRLILLVKNGVVNRPTAKEVFEQVFLHNADPEAYVKEKGLEMVSDDGAVRAVVCAVLAANPQSVAQFKEGSEKVARFLMGQSMKQLKGKADPALVNQIIAEELTKL